MNTIDTRYGSLPVEGPVERSPEGILLSAALAAPVSLDTAAGRLVPQHSIDDARRMHKPPVTFHPNGQVRSVPLETRTVVATPAGPLPAELVTFHENGAIARVFPLNGKLSGYWTEADEAGMAETLAVATSVGTIASRFVAVAFDDAGRLRSLTLWPGEDVEVAAPCGRLPARLGLSFHPGGGLRSLEPARPVPVPTLAGTVLAYDPDAVGISGDDNSLVFDPAGQVVRVATVRSTVLAGLPGGLRRELSPLVRESICGDGDHELTPLFIEFSEDCVTARLGQASPFAVIPRQDVRFAVRPFVPAFAVAFAPKQCSM
ncbi:hypothetical protein [Solidesulfovibrio sp.]